MEEGECGGEGSLGAGQGRGNGCWSVPAPLQPRWERPGGAGSGGRVGMQRGQWGEQRGGGRGVGSRLPRTHWGDLLEPPRNPPPGPARGLAPTTCTCVVQPLDVKGPDPRLPKAPLREHMSFGHLHAPFSTCPCLQQGCGRHFQIPEPQNLPCLHSDSDPGPGPPGRGAGTPVEGTRSLSYLFSLLLSRI